MSKKVGRPAAQQTCAMNTAERMEAPKALVYQLWAKYKLNFSVDRGMEQGVIEELEKMGYKAKVFPADIASKEEAAHQDARIAAIGPGLIGIKGTRTHSLDVANIAYLKRVATNISAYIDNLILEDRKRTGDIKEEEAKP